VIYIRKISIIFFWSANFFFSFTSCFNDRRVPCHILKLRNVKYSTVAWFFPTKYLTSRSMQSRSDHRHHSLLPNRKNMPWSQVAAKKRTSLMNATFENNIHNSQKDKVIHSKVWRTGRSPGSVLLDMTDRSESPCSLWP
jgi:hypothetical protein